MDSSNPYEAPRAEVVSEPLASSELAAAVADLPKSRGPVLFLAIACVVLALASAGQSLVMVATSYGAMSSSFGIIMISVASTIITYLVSAGLLLWMWTDLKKVSGNPSTTDVARVFDTLARIWMVFAGLLFIPLLSSVAMSVVPMVMPIAGAVIAGLAGSSDLLAAATRWRNMVRVFIIVGGVMLLVRAAMTFGTGYFTPATVGWGMQAQFWLFGGTIIQLGVGALMWRQVPALEAFIATPNAATLTTVAATHRFTWRFLAWASVAFVILAAVAGGVLAVVL